MSNYGINRKYKDRLFTFIFGREENKARTMEQGTVLCPEKRRNA